MDSFCSKSLTRSIWISSGSFRKYILDRTKPLTQIVHGRKLSYLGPGGLMGEQLVFEYEIFTLVTMDESIQLTRMRESMLDLSDP
ncbi:hypothetical protein Lal_00033629 [Lupinus albus]|nr:hypothetical protein Lal_00033629 [Lupinus albus]